MDGCLTDALGSRLMFSSIGMTLFRPRSIPSTGSNDVAICVYLMEVSEATVVGQRLWRGRTEFEGEGVA